MEFKPELLPENFGYVAAVIVAFWVQQGVLFVIPVGIQRSKTGIKPPYLYPTDALIKDLKLNDSQVQAYMCAQRVHQNNVEFLCIFFPVFILAGLYNPLHASVAGAIVWLGRLVTALGYWHNPSARVAGGWFHIPELYIVWLAGMFAYSLIVKA